ncbi:MAG: hypothetical protein L6420_03250 [Elusimicrobia bacterium]|nr:hypothetical protein [Elusimicrobiota bacterium]
MKLSKPEEILIAMFMISKGKIYPCRYEDVVVKVFKMFHKDFQLRGYPQFPDSSDIHKPLYGSLKSKGLVKSANKTFTLTEKGISLATKLLQFAESGRSINHQTKRLTRDVELEIARIKQASVCKFYFSGEKEKILDIDFYSYLGVNVRTGKNDFIGRLNTVSEAIRIFCDMNPKSESKLLIKLHLFLLDKFAKLIQIKSGGK